MNENDPPEGAEALLEELDLGSARGGRRAGPEVCIRVVRPLTREDLPRLEEGGAAAVPTLDAIRSSHHQLAQLIAKGMSQVEAGMITGYSGTYISVLVNHDPAFKELLAHYAREREQVFVDVMQRVKVLGLEVNDLLLERLRDDPDKWTNQQLMDLHKETLGKLATGSPAGSPTGVQIGKLEVSFVGAGPEPAAGAGTTVIIEAEAEEIQDE